jgi:acetyltransferase-like isoleucine patch superfamily enzyme
MMRLGDLPLRADERLLRDAAFAQFGMAADAGRAILSPVSTPRHLKQALANSETIALIATPDLCADVPGQLGLIEASRPLETLFRLHCTLFEQGGYRHGLPSRIGVDPVIHASAVVADEDVTIGDRVRIGPGAIVLAGTTIGDDVVIGPGVVLGSTGFEVRVVDGRRRVIPHVGGVAIGDRVELQANTSVSRALFAGDTVIGPESATDNLVHIAHNVRIGARCRLAASAMIAGSTTLGDDVWIGPNATISSGLRIGDGAAVSLGAVVTRDVAPQTTVTGHFAVEHGLFLRMFRRAMKND